MKKSELVSIVANEAGISNAAAERVINAATAAITKSLKRGDPVRLTGFGSFAVRNSKARNGRNPRTGEALKIKASKRPVFVPGKNLKDAVN